MPENKDFSAPLSLLALDTCTEFCSVALQYQGQVFAREADAPREHSQRLLPMVQEVLQEAGISLSQVDVIAYGRGPGSFTGIRICTSMTQGLALGQDLPVVGISTLAAMAQAAITLKGAAQVATAIDARMGEIYWGEYRAVDGLASLVGEERVCAPEELSSQLAFDTPLAACGTGFDAYPALLTEQMSLVEEAKFPLARFMLPLAEAAVKAGLATEVDQLQPVYLRDTVTWKKLPGRE
ncbi:MULTISPECIES: tRNA (adenosine(37)-N6)-threonylcarbamoyltransferase complex dimerization subunit type 1 TsaB [Shewanella]|uniref:tRNA threonylcarbamoyladenosine biosynthesis protein TsaB n=1 Tax=Shewanella insulae TaxID=2681496 RepID=A0A6L7HTU1_9GAMM|nr:MULTISPECIES: tRNA (adenosine(37)-N6)-threonylcarbamoyltransferase complex dimerization subunit type 1 TsaB [Shewanella]MCL2911095.1 tRNA (adenosine(37)-N6)-threonylcarbamoyltransferase complex dimerization subunit type 1 TsaB [Shewanella aquimarina]MXR67573.1 tRNA (adenosine(37)-N6)-threonylcarbamoyltransferase complex dimerization subunit type 1 TsaB [Shewanella insulae]